MHTGMRSVPLRAVHQFQYRLSRRPAIRHEKSAVTIPQICTLDRSSRASRRGRRARSCTAESRPARRSRPIAAATRPASARSRSNPSATFPSTMPTKSGVTALLAKPTSRLRLVRNAIAHNRPQDTSVELQGGPPRPDCVRQHTSDERLGDDRIYQCRDAARDVRHSNRSAEVGETGQQVDHCKRRETQHRARAESWESRAAC